MPTGMPTSPTWSAFTATKLPTSRRRDAVTCSSTTPPCPATATWRRGRASRPRGEDPDELTDAYVGLINAAIAERPAGMLVGLHMCRGNFKGAWMAEGGYEPIAERVFAGLDVDVLQLEYDTPRAGDFAPLRFLPPDKTAVLGLISTKTPGAGGRRLRQAPHRRGRPPRAARTPRPRPAMRLLVRRRRRPADRFRRHPPKTRARPPDRRRSLGHRLTPLTKRALPSSPLALMMILIINNIMRARLERCWSLTA